MKPDTCFELTVRAYGAHPAAFVLDEDDGVSYDFDKGAQNRLTLNWSAGDGGKVEKTGTYAGPARYKVTEWMGETK